jgi:hypothetical protein
MIAELDAAIEKLEDVNAKLIEISRNLQERVGIARSLIDAEYEQLRRIADSDEPHDPATTREPCTIVSPSTSDA